ncbi:protein of unknown function [Paraburkholderia kururiensis]
MQVVGGSNPLAPTKEIKALQAMLVRPFSFCVNFAPTFAPTGGTALAGTERSFQQARACNVAVDLIRWHMPNP